MSLFQQSIELPFADPFLKLYPHHALAAGILQNNEHILPLLLTDYVQLVYDKDVQRMDFSVSLYIQSYIKHIPLTFQSLVPREIVEHGYKNPVEFIRTSLEHGYYVYCIVDTYYIGAYQKCYHMHHMLHDMAIYGYDKKTREYHVADCFVDGKYKREIISEKELKDGLEIAYDKDWLDGFVLLKYNENPYRGITYDIEWIKKEIDNYLNGEPSGWVTISEYRRRIPWLYVYGIEVYDALEEYLEEKEKKREVLDLRLPAALLEHKKVMLKIAEQLHETGRLEAVSEVREVFEELMEMAKNMELLMAKYNTADGGGLSALKELVRNIQAKDIAAMTLFQENIKDQAFRIIEGTSAEVKFLEEDRNTGGNWKEEYGSQGYHVVGAEKQLPEYVAQDGYIIRNAVCVLLKMYAEGENVLFYNRQDNRRVQAYYLSAETFYIHICLADKDRHKISFYFLDYDRLQREQTVEVIHAGTGQVIDRKLLSDFHKGVYLSYEVMGAIILKITKINGPDAVISGVFWD